jgi:hypothetical protein
MVNVCLPIIQGLVYKLFDFNAWNLREPLEFEKYIEKRDRQGSRIGLSEGIDRLCCWDDEVILSLPAIASLLDGKEQVRVVDAV